MNEKSITYDRTNANASGRNTAAGHPMSIRRQSAAGAAGMRRSLRSGTHVNFHAGKDSGNLHEVIGALKVYGDRSIF
jgi:hypothetical protein